MASITIGNIYGGAQVNPTSLYYPVNINGVFNDGMLLQNDVGTILETINTPGLVVDQVDAFVRIGDNNLHIIADLTQNETLLNCSDGRVHFKGVNITAATAGAASGQFLVVTVNNQEYKLNLLDV